MTVLIAYDDKRRKSKITSALDNFRNPFNGYHAGRQFTHGAGIDLILSHETASYYK